MRRVTLSAESRDRSINPTPLRLVLRDSGAVFPRKLDSCSRVRNLPFTHQINGPTPPFSRPGRGESGYVCCVHTGGRASKELKTDLIHPAVLNPANSKPPETGLAPPTRQPQRLGSS